MFLNPLLVAVLAGLPALAFQQSNPPAQQQSGQPQQQQSEPHGSSSQQRTTHTGSGQLAKAEGKFVHKALMGGKHEVDLATMAAERASSSDVKSFAQRLVTDHTKANEELSELASRKGMDVPGVMPGKAVQGHDKSNKDKAVMDRMSKLSGESFDRAFMEYKVRHHQQEVKEFERMAAQAKDPDVRAFAAKTVPVLKEHLEEARSISGKVGAATSSSTSGRDTKRSN
jgi:putative membrane protein